MRRAIQELPAVPLKRALELAKRVTAKSSIPILAEVLLTELDGRLVLDATDLYTWVRCDVGPAPTGWEPTVVSPRALLALIGDDTAPALERRNDTLWCGGGSVRAAYSPKDYPDRPGDPATEPHLRARAGDLLAAMQATLPASSWDTTRPHMHSLHLQPAADGRMRAVATDGHRLHVAEFPAALGGGGELAKTSPVALLFAQPSAATIAAALKLAPADAEVSARWGGGYALVSVGAIAIGARLVDEQFPPTDKVVPKHQTHAVECSLAELAAALKRVSKFTNAKSGAMKLEIGHVDHTDALRLAAEDVDKGSLALDVAATRLLGDGEYVVGVCCRYLGDALGAVKTMAGAKARVQLSFGVSELDPIKVEAAGFFAVCMPLRM